MHLNGTDVIPTVDLSAFTSGGDLQSREQAATELARSCRPHGCVAITGHGVPSALLKDAFDTSKLLFDLPLEEKMKAPHPDAFRPHRGYSAIGRERGAAKGAMDTEDEKRKEELKRVTDYKLPEDILPGFRRLTTELFWRLRDTSMAILDALIMSLGLSEEEAVYVRSIHSGHNNQLRLLHYPPISTEVLKNKDLSRLGEHKDFSSFTLLFQDTHGGLEFANCETGGFMQATPKPDTVYINIGDMFERLSNGFYPAATHRVTIPGRESSSTDGGTEVTSARYSIPYFVGPDYDGVIAPQQSLVLAHQNALYEPTTYRNFSEKMFKATLNSDN